MQTTLNREADRTELLIMKRGRGHTKIEQNGVTRKVSDEGVLRLPKSITKLGIALNQEVKIILVKDNDNPLNWQIQVLPVLNYDPELEK